jgi:hypothetical protein
VYTVFIVYTTFYKFDKIKFQLLYYLAENYKTGSNPTSAEAGIAVPSVWAFASVSYIGGVCGLLCRWPIQGVAQICD